MAKANTYEISKGGYNLEKSCALCDQKPSYRAFYYPTYMNGDAEWLGDYCEDHKSVKLEDITPEEVRRIYRQFNHNQ